MDKMKTTILITLALFTIIYTKGQNEVPDFTITDIHGNSYNLYTETAEGKIVVLDFYSVACNTCIINTPTIQNIWETYGYNGDSLWVWGVESTPVNDTIISNFETDNSVTFPGFSTLIDDTLKQLFHISYTPQYYIICPDNTAKAYAVGNLIDGINLCKSTTPINSPYINDIKVNLSNNSIAFKNLPETETIIELTDITGKKMKNIILNQRQFELNVNQYHNQWIICTIINKDRIIYKEKIWLPIR